MKPHPSMTFPQKNPYVRRHLARRDLCPECGGDLDTGFECTDCGYDAVDEAYPPADRERAARAAPRAEDGER